ncbi:MAG: peptidylprolyl isomerase, partial [Bacteroidota bacterium]|nr:peptidylprolyl isomerase [Bacteroidota bacterium]
MKRTVLILCLTLGFSSLIAQTNDPVIMKIANQNISKSEFEYIWNKNNTNNTVDKKSLDEYIDLFVNFKLKVAEAEAQGIDTTKAFIDELSGYRRQLIAPYLTDKDAQEKLMKQTYDRIREYVEASHILIKVGPDATPEDTLAAYNKAMMIYKKAIVKGADFAKLAKDYSEDGTKDQGGYLGYATGFRYIYAFENALYNTPVGTISRPVRTEYGYHIIKIHSRRPANGRYRSGHIMKIIRPDATAEEKKAAEDAIFKAYEELKSGVDFAKVAQSISDDQASASRGGEYGFMYCGTLPFEYEEAVYKLKPGEYSEPFQSRYGWHIVKALEFLPYPSMDEMKEEINSIINRDERAQEPRTVLTEKLKAAYGFHQNGDLSTFAKAWDAQRISKDTTGVRALLQSDKPLFTLANTACPQKKFAAYLSSKSVLGNNVNKAYSNFVKDQVIAYEDTQLEHKYPDFGHLMEEYHDGILLFEVSNREVWEKATKDTKGLETYFAANKADYAWNKPHFKGYVVRCATNKVAAKAKKLINKLPADSVMTVLKRTFNTDSTTLIRVENGLYIQGDNPVTDSLIFKQTKTKQDAQLPVAFVKGHILANGPEEYTDVRGLVISDYQNYLEKK